MLKLVLTASILAGAFAGPALAQDAMMKCDKGSMMKLQSEIYAIKDTDMAMKDKKLEAMKELNMAKTSMKQHKTEACQTHMGKAMQAMGHG